MKINGKWIYIKNHTIENLSKMHEWNNDEELLEIECGSKNKITSIETFRETMESYIENNPDCNSHYCHFGIHRKSNDELIGYADLLPIDGDLENVELSIAIPSKKLRNKIYGIDSIIAVLYCAFKIKEIKKIKFQTRVDNLIVMKICEKLGIEYTVTKFNQNGYFIDLACFVIGNELFNKIIPKLVKNYEEYYFVEKEEHPPSVAGAS